MDWRTAHHVIYDGSVPADMTVNHGPGPAELPTLELPAVPPPFDPEVGQTTSSPGELGSW